MGHHGNHLEFCGQSENCFVGVPKYFWLKYMTKKEHFEKNYFWVVVGGWHLLLQKWWIFGTSEKFVWSQFIPRGKNVLKFLSWTEFKLGILTSLDLNMTFSHVLFKSNHFFLWWPPHTLGLGGQMVVPHIILCKKTWFETKMLTSDEKNLTLCFA